MRYQAVLLAGDAIVDVSTGPACSGSDERSLAAPGESADRGSSGCSAADDGGLLAGGTGFLVTPVAVAVPRGVVIDVSACSAGDRADGSALAPTNQSAHRRSTRRTAADDGRGLPYGAGLVPIIPVP